MQEIEETDSIKFLVKNFIDDLYRHAGIELQEESNQVPNTPEETAAPVSPEAQKELEIAPQTEEIEAENQHEPTPVKTPEPEGPTKEELMAKIEEMQKEMDDVYVNFQHNENKMSVLKK